MNKFKRNIFQVILASSLVLSSFALTPTAEAKTIATVQAAQEYDIFLKDKFNIAIDSTITKGQYLSYTAEVLPGDADAEHLPVFSDLEATQAYYIGAAELYQQGIIDGQAVRADEALSPYVATLIALRAAGLTELAATYNEEKTNAALANINSKADNWAPHVAQQLAAAIDAQLIEDQYYAEFNNKTASASFVQSLLVQVAAHNGSYKNYIGYISDKDIVTKIAKAYEASDIIQVEALQAIVDIALENEAITGYNFKDERFNANFVDQYAITYGHSDLKHALQLLQLLRSENIDAKVQFEPKTSAFLYLADWGTPSESEDFQVKQIKNGNYIAYSKEFDLSFEFNSINERDRFQAIILDYAKKDADDEPGLIYGSWWQPLYYTNSHINDYTLISNNKISDGGHYYAQSFSLNEQVSDIAKGIKAVDADAQIESYQFWANIAFYNYLGGTDFK